MPSPNKGYYQPGFNTDVGAWGINLNNELTGVLDLNLGWQVSVALSSSNVTLTTGATGQMQNLIVTLTGTLLANVAVSSAAVGFYLVENTTTGNFTVTWQANFGAGGVGTAWVIPQGYRGLFFTDTTNGTYPITWFPTITAATSGATPATIRRTENDTSPHQALSIQSGSGSGNDYRIYETGDGSNNVATVTEQIGATVIGSKTVSAQSFPIPVELAEIATPLAPASGNILLYGYTGDVLAYETPGGQQFLVGQPRTVQAFTTAGGGTYTPTTGTALIRVVMVGASGGVGTSGSPGNGGQTIFGGWKANGGNAGAAPSASSAAGGAGGTGGANGTGTLIRRQAGGAGGNSLVSGTVALCGAGGTSALGGNGQANYTSSVSGGVAPVANSGSGTGGPNGGSSTIGGASGAGEYVEFWMTAAQIGASLSYTVGAKGAAGSGSGMAGSDGGIWVEEFYA